MEREDNPIVRYMDKPTPMKAIHAKCAECMGCTKLVLERGFRTSISTCKSYSCPLYRFRPYRPKQDSFRGEKGVTQ